MFFTEAIGETGVGNEPFHHNRLVGLVRLSYFQIHFFRDSRKGWFRWIPSSDETLWIKVPWYSSRAYNLRAKSQREYRSASQRKDCQQKVLALILTRFSYSSSSTYCWRACSSFIPWKACNVFILVCFSQLTCKDIFI